jgi:midasin
VGDWVLLDEVNLAPSDTLQRLSGLLDATSMGDGGLCLTERGDVDTLVGPALSATPPLAF